MNKKMVDVVCENPDCKKEFQRYIGEYNRRKRLGKKQYCSLQCYAKHDGVNNLKFVTTEDDKINRENIKKYAGNRRDCYSAFRYFVKVLKNENRSEKRTLGHNELDLGYLKQLWETQKGKCPITGWDLELPNGSYGWVTKANAKRASLDRIDNSKGYEKGNVRFVSFMANLARNVMSDAELIEFCKAVSMYNKDS